MSTDNANKETTMATTRTRMAVATHGEAEGRADYADRRSDVDAGQAEPTWAWPFQGADEAYINAVGPREICRAVGVNESAWDEIASDWCAAFERGYRAEHDEAADAS